MNGRHYGRPESPPRRPIGLRRTSTPRGDIEVSVSHVVLSVSTSCCSISGQRPGFIGREPPAGQRPASFAAPDVPLPGALSRTGIALHTHLNRTRSKRNRTKKPNDRTRSHPIAPKVFSTVLRTTLHIPFHKPTIP